MSPFLGDFSLYLLLSSTAWGRYLVYSLKALNINLVLENISFPRINEAACSPWSNAACTTYRHSILRLNKQSPNAVLITWRLAPTGRLVRCHTAHGLLDTIIQETTQTCVCLFYFYALKTWYPSSCGHSPWFHAHSDRWREHSAQMCRHSFLWPRILV